LRFTTEPLEEGYMPAMVEVLELVKQYSGATTPAVDGVTFSVDQGEVFSLLGPNGAGKTTTLSVLSCLLAPTSGDARLGGHSVRADPMGVKRLLGVVPQEVALYLPLTASENLNFWGKMYGLGGADLKRRVDEALDLVGLRDRAGERIETYSGGMRRRINIAVGLLHRPEVLFMDEPTVGIDPQSRRSILDTVKALNQQGMTVLYTTHYMEEAQELSHRIGVIDHGKLIALGTLEELTRLVGQEDAIELRIAGEHVPPELTEALRRLPGISQVSAEDGAVRLLVPDANRALADVVAAVGAHGAKIASVAVQEPNLEAVFLHLTGRALRD
jgi:ABC-2 type transport system ATP-binding protein